VVKQGGAVLVQDEATSVVWGMPGAVAGAGLAEAILPLPELAAALVSRVRGHGALPGQAPPARSAP
jgi:two-component system chemotaxis response regulator CheB